jgi:hypothetical protein
MKRIMIGLTWLTSCVVCAAVAWHAREVALEKRMEEYKGIFNHWQERMSQMAVSPGEVVTAQFDMMGSNQLQCLLRNADKEVLANISVNVHRRHLDSITLYGGASGKPTGDIQTHPNGTVAIMTLCLDTRQLRDWAFDQSGVLQSATVYTNNVGMRQYYAPDGTVTGSCKIGICNVD